MPNAQDRIAHEDESTERSAEALEILTGLALAALLGAIVSRQSVRMTNETLVAIALAIGAMGHVAAGIVGRVHAEGLIDRLWPLSGPLRTLMFPLTSISHVIESWAYRYSRRAAHTPRPASVEVEIHRNGDDTENDIDADLPESTREMLERVVELARRDVSELMVPRSLMLALPATVTASEAARAFVASGYSRIPIFGVNRDDILGVLYAKDLFAHQVASAEGEPELAPASWFAPRLCVPETKNANDLLQEFQSRRLQIAIVLDEYGGVAGLITLEDLLEELVGPIDDEHDRPSPTDTVVPIGGSLYEIDASLTIEELNEELDLRLPTDEDFSTLGGLVFTTVGHLPEPGDSFRREGIEFTVLEVVDRSIRRVRLDLSPAATVNTQ